MCLGHLHGWQHKTQTPMLDYLGFSGECITSSVLSYHSKNLKWWTSVTSLLQLFYSASKRKYTLKALERVDPKGGAPVHPGFLLLYVCLLPSLSLPYANWTGQEGGVFVSPEVLTPCPWIFLLFHFCGLFPFSVF